MLSPSSIPKRVVAASPPFWGRVSASRVGAWAGLLMSLGVSVDTARSFLSETPPQRPRTWEVHSLPLKQRNGSDDRFAIAPAVAEAQGGLMLNLISLLIGAVALVLGVLAFIPLLGRAYWLIIPIAMAGLVLGMMSDRNIGRI